MSDDVPDDLWLTDEQMAAWLPFMRTFVQLPHALDRQLRETAGINHAHYGILAMLSAQPDRTLSMSALAHQTATSPSRLSHAVAGLEQRGWVERSQCTEDKRMQYAALTPAGQALLDEVAPGHVATVRRLVFDQLSATDVADLRRILTKIVAAVEG
ncbi:MarR family transcriptional regulator [Nocardioides sp. Root190]|uniref:MarR family winged helix-turn-helix transcriptional regulator n=1 Tax=Nocardioides sp. Root190 TaxID=1736488 RepID=UPI0006FABB9E|nr:MarR family transcriptional regulator [Nocardioides sp. Root190]KRB80477.1 MarR family transcriptional regulator [Nocardioides sp. Root190]